jgi:hypothetical protein
VFDAGEAKNTLLYVIDFEKLTKARPETPSVRIIVEMPSPRDLYILGLTCEKRLSH